MTTCMATFPVRSAGFALALSEVGFEPTSLALAGTEGRVRHPTLSPKEARRAFRGAFLDASRAASTAGLGYTTQLGCGCCFVHHPFRVRPHGTMAYGTGAAFYTP